MRKISLSERGKSVASLPKFGRLLCMLGWTLQSASADWNPRPGISDAERALARQAYASAPLSSRKDTPGTAAGRERMLFSFEGQTDGARILAENCRNIGLYASADNGVTRGQQCARVVSTASGSYGEFVFNRSASSNWAGFDYIAVDVHLTRAQHLTLQLEIRDKDSRDYFTRCTMARGFRKGSHTLVWPISRLRRNGKEGLDETQLRRDDVIALDDIAEVKLFFETPEKGKVEFWMDSIRLLHREVLYPPMELELPAAVTLAVDFGPADWLQRDFMGISSVTAIDQTAPARLETSTGLFVGGSGWPDPLSGTFVTAEQSGVLRFRAPVPNGQYRALILAGQHVQASPRQRRYFLRVNGKDIYDDLPQPERIDSVAYLHRFMWTAYSERQDSLFLDFIERMYPVHDVTIDVTDGEFSLAARNCLLSGLMLLPVAHAGDADRLRARLRLARAEAFAGQSAWPHKRAGDVATVKDGPRLDVFIPDPDRPPHPKLRARGGEIDRRRIAVTAVPGQNLFARFCVRAAADAGWAEVRVSDAVGMSSSIPRGSAKVFVSNYRYSPDGVAESGLLPTSRSFLEAEITQTFHLWWRVPANVAPGLYMANIDVAVELWDVRRIPMEIEICAARLVEPLPAALGFYYQNRGYAPFVPDSAYARHLAAFRSMRALGMTSVTLPDVARVTGIDEKAGKTTIQWDDTSIRAACEAGLGISPAQPLLLEQLSLARGIARRLPGMQGDFIDRQPGAELRHGAFRGLWFDAMENYRRWVETQQGHFAFEVTDEPRENPNPWNRNLADTYRYGQWMGEIGVKRFVTLMGDQAGGADYTKLVDVVDIVSVHSNPHTDRLKKLAIEQDKLLWFFNDGLSRQRWGFFPWANHVTGRFEWHWCWPGEVRHNQGGYPGEDWHNPFTRMHGIAPNAPFDRDTDGVLLSSALFDAAEGITDYHYAVTLALLLNEKSAARKNIDAESRARALLDEIRVQALEGQSRPDVWRRRVARQLAELQVNP